MSQWLKTLPLTCKPKFVPRVYMVEGENRLLSSCPLTSTGTNMGCGEVGRDGQGGFIRILAGASDQNQGVPELQESGCLGPLGPAPSQQGWVGGWAGKTVVGPCLERAFMVGLC